MKKVLIPTGVALCALLFSARAEVRGQPLPVLRRGDSRAELAGTATKTVNTTFEFSRGGSRQGALLFKFAHAVEYSGGEGQDGRYEIEAFDARKNLPLWKISDERSDAHRILDKYFLLTTVRRGCCGSRESFRAFSELTGEFLFAYSDISPIVLVAGYDEPQVFRFVGYQDNDEYLVRDTIKFADPDGKWTLAGVLTYASPLKAVQKLAIFYDEKSQEQPAKDQSSSISISYKDKEWFSRGRPDLSLNTEVDYWWRGKNGRDPEDREKAFDDLLVKLNFAYGSVSIPIVKDRMDISGLKITGSFYKKVIALPPEYWGIHDQ